MHVGLIADGNRRWAKSQNLPLKEGHLQGFKTIKEEILPTLRQNGVKSFAVYAFSTENWKRSPLEVKNLLDLFGEIFDRWATELLDEKIRLIHAGRKDRLPPKLTQKITQLEQASAHFTQFTIYLCLDYGSENEITNTINKLKETHHQITEKQIRENLQVPMLDLIIRTGGEKRLSNFCLYQASYAELCFLSKPLPDIKKSDIKNILQDFHNRDRRKGK